jgi:hypothetical protein
VSQARTKTFALRQKTAGVATAEQLQVINTYTLREFAADEVMVREYVLAHNCIDRDKECFDEALLADFSRTLPGKGIFIRHPGGWDGDTGPGEGLIFAAAIEQVSLEKARELLRQPDLTLPPDRSMVSLLKTSGFFAKTPDNEAFLIKHDAGIVSQVSVAFTASERNRIKGPDGIELNAWRWVGPGEGLEQSLVWLGAQPGARAIKNANRNSEDQTVDQNEIQQKLTQTEGHLAAAKPKAAAYDALKAALGDNAGLADDPAQLVVLVDAGKAFRNDLVETIVKADRAAGRLGDDEAAVTAAKKDYEAMPMRALKALAERVDMSGNTSTPGVGAGNPNASKHNEPSKAANDMPGEFGSKAFG